MERKHMSVARVEKLTAANVGKAERHNERKNESYANLNVVPERIPWNVSFKSPEGMTYNEYFKTLLDQGKISVRGLKDNATLFDELIVDVNTEYFESHGGYAYAKDFYEEAFRFCCKLYGEDNVVSAVMHADEINKEVSERLGRPVYHYHLHVVAIPTVDKEIRWTKRCKDPALVGKVKEVIHQVSHSKKWKNTVPMVDERGRPVLNKSGKPVLVRSYSILQDQLFDHMRAAGFSDIERGERGSTTEHLTALEFQIRQDAAHDKVLRDRISESYEILDDTQEQIEAKSTELGSVTDQLAAKQDELSKVSGKISKAKKAYKDVVRESSTLGEIEAIGKPTITGKIVMERRERKMLGHLAEEGLLSRGEIGRLKDTIDRKDRQIDSLERRVNRLEDELSKAREALSRLREQYNALLDLVQPYLEALRRFPDEVKSFLTRLLPAKPKEAERELPPPAKQKKRSRDMEL